MTALLSLVPLACGLPLALGGFWRPQETAPDESPTPGFSAVLVVADGVPIDVDLGHAAPLFRDFDGDGLEDLLVGQFGDGLLRIYRNVGRRGAPAFDRFEWFQTQSGPGSIPAG